MGEQGLEPRTSRMRTTNRSSAALTTRLNLSSEPRGAILRTNLVAPGHLLWSARNQLFSSEYGAIIPLRHEAGKRILRVRIFRVRAH